MMFGDIKNMTDEQLSDARKNLPAYLNDMSDDQRALANAVYAEQKRRYDDNKKTAYCEYNQQVEAAGYKVGDKVSCFALNLLGTGGMTVTGTVQKRRKYYVKLDVVFNGKKTAHLTKAWKLI